MVFLPLRERAWVFDLLVSCLFDLHACKCCRVAGTGSRIGGLEVGPWGLLVCV